MINHCVRKIILSTTAYIYLDKLCFIFFFFSSDSINCTNSCKKKKYSNQDRRIAQLQMSTYKQVKNIQYFENINITLILNLLLLHCIKT